MRGRQKERVRENKMLSKNYKDICRTEEKKKTIYLAHPWLCATDKRSSVFLGKFQVCILHSIQLH